MEVRVEINVVISSELGASLKSITENSHLLDDLKADSLDVVSLSIQLEDRFDIVIPDEDINKWETVGDIYKYFEGLGQELTEPER